MTGYLGDVAALARKDLLVELRTRDTVPAMLLFVVAALVVFHFALPAESSRLAASGMLWIALLFTALLALVRAFVGERDQGTLDGLILAPCDRSAIWLGKTLSVARVPAVRRGRRAAGVRAVLRGRDVGARRRGRARERGDRRRRDAARRDGGRRARARAASCRLLFLPVAIPLVVGGVGATVADDPGRYLAFLALYDLIFAILSWASFEYVVTE